MAIEKKQDTVGTLAKAGAALFVLWGLLHIWVGAEGVHQYIAGDVKTLWDMLIGGSIVPREAFQHTHDAATAYAQKHLILNFCLDVGGYGVLGMVVAFLIWTRASWAAYFIGVFIIGIADLAFLFTMVAPGVIEMNVGTVGGPIIWFFAISITPFGLPAISKRTKKN